MPSEHPPADNPVPLVRDLQSSPAPALQGGVRELLGSR